MDYFELFWWFFVNIIIPVFAPIVFPLIGLLSSTHHDRAKKVAHKAVEDGQLFWLVIVLLSAACYELLEYQHMVPKGIGSNIAGLAILMFALIGSASVGLVLVQAYTLTSATEADEAPSLDTGILQASKFFTVLAIVGLLAAHIVSTATKEHLKEVKDKQFEAMQVQLDCIKAKKEHCFVEKGE